MVEDIEELYAELHVQSLPNEWGVLGDSEIEVRASGTTNRIAP
jgi:hypothetical protein